MLISQNTHTRKTTSMKAMEMISNLYQSYVIDAKEKKYIVKLLREGMENDYFALINHLYTLKENDKKNSRLLIELINVLYEEETNGEQC